MTNPDSTPWDQRLARRLVQPLVGTRVTPNQITTLSLLLGLAAAAGFATGDPGWAKLAAVAFALSTFVDHGDGELARLSGQSTPFGARYDTAVSAVTKTLLFIGIGLGMRDTLGGIAIILGLVAGAAIAVIFSLLGRLRRQGGEAARQPAAAGFEIEDILYLIVPITFLGWHGQFLLAAVVGAPLFALWLLLRTRKGAISS